MWQLCLHRFFSVSFMKSNWLTIKLNGILQRGKHGYYHPQTKLWEGNVFTGVCPSFYSAGVMVHHIHYVIGHPSPWTWELGPTLSINLLTWGPTPPSQRYWHLVVATKTYGWQAGGTHPTGMLSCFIFQRLQVNFFLSKTCSSSCLNSGKHFTAGWKIFMSTRKCTNYSSFLLQNFK